MDWQSATTKDDGTVSIPDRWLFLHYYEALNILFRMENALRVFVYIVLKDKFKEKWADTALQTAEEEQSTIAGAAAKRLAQAKGYGYLGYEIASPLMYLNSGELTRIIVAEAYWEIFKPFFRAKKEIIRTKLDEIGMVRNALAHFRPLKYDDIELIKQNVKHTFIGIEQCLTEVTQTNRVVPTNTDDPWYKNLSTLGSNSCTVRLFQDSSEKWIRIEIDYACAVLRNSGPGRHRQFTISKLISPAVVKGFPALAGHCIFVTERIKRPQIREDKDPDFRKLTSLTFSKNATADNFGEINEQIKKVLVKIETETELVQKDNLARGSLIDSAQIWAFQRKDEESVWWSTDLDPLKSEFGESDPPEYWGDLGGYAGDFIAASPKYPWMPSDISKEDLPF